MYFGHFFKLRFYEYLGYFKISRIFWSAWRLAKRIPYWQDQWKDNCENQQFRRS